MTWIYGAYIGVGVLLFVCLIAGAIYEKNWSAKGTVIWAVLCMFWPTGVIFVTGIFVGVEIEKRRVIADEIRKSKTT